MHTRFEIWIACEDGVYAEQAAANAFQKLNSLEQNLSRFIPNSDIGRFNHALADRPVRMDDSSLRCLKIADRMSGLSGGAFDVTVGPLTDAWKTGSHPSAKEIRRAMRCIGFKHVRIEAENHTAVRTCDGVRLDLGGVGKGFAVDRMADELREWDIVRALIHGGASSVLGFGGPDDRQGWPVQISHPEGEQILSRFELTDEAMGASGLEKGAHILDPRTGRPVSHHRAAWVRGASAAETDALSTACMILNPEQIAKLAGQPGLGVWIIDRNGRSKRFGNWKGG